MQHTLRYLYLSLVFVLFSFSSYGQDCPGLPPNNVTPSGSLYICNGNPVRFIANEGNTDPNLTYKWQINGHDVPNNTGQEFIVTEALIKDEQGQIGSVVFEVTRKIVGNCPEGSNTSNPVIVTIGPDLAKPNFTVDHTEECSGVPISFHVDDPSTVQGVVYRWNFGDGTPEIEGINVQHSFDNPGLLTRTFDVKVRAVYNNCSSAESDKITVQIIPRPNLNPTEIVDDSVNFQVCLPVDSTKARVRVKLRNLNTTIAANITGYEIDFSDGSGPRTFTPTEFNAVTPIRNLIPYDTVGTYPIRIRAIGNNGCETLVVKDFNVSKKPNAGFQVLEKKRVDVPNFPLDPAACTPVTVAVADTSKGGNLTYKWSVMDNRGQPANGVRIVAGTETSKALTFEFSEQGRFNIQMIAENTCGKDTTSQSVLIAYPEVQLSGGFVSCGDTTIAFTAENVFYDTNLGTEKPETIKWVITGTSGATFVENTSDNSKYPVIRFPNIGEYKVSVSFANECGNSRDVAQPGSAEATITINPIPRAPTFNSNEISICSGDSTTLRPNGPSGSTFRYYITPTGGTPLATGTTYNTDPLTVQTKYYVTTVNQNNCESTGPRTLFTVNVLPPLANNNISTDQEVCQGSAPKPFNGTAPTGGEGSGYRYLWVVSTTGPDGTYNPAPGPSPNNSSNYTAPALQQNAWFRRIVSSASCSSDTSNVIAITITPRLAGGTITGEQQICANEPAMPLVGSTLTGGTIQWRMNTTGPNARFVTPAAGINTEENYEPGTLTRTTWFRRYVTSGGCVDSSNVVAITVNQLVSNNTITADQALCGGLVPAPLTGSTPTGGTLPLRYIWESSTTSATDGFAPAGGTNNSPNYNPAAITQTTWFRRGVISGSCDPNYSNVVQLTVLPAIANNTITAPETAVCENTPLKTITGSSPTGGQGTFTYLWESSITSATAAFAPAAGTNNTQNYTSPGITRTTWFRRVVTSGTCSSVSQVIEIRVNKLPVAPTVQAANITTCPDSTATLVATGNGTTYQWFETATGGNILFEGATFETDPITKTTTFYVQSVNQTQCVSATRTPVTVSVSSITAGAGRDTTIVEGNTMELVGTGGVRYKWEPAAGLNDPNIARPVASPTKTTTYKVTAYSEEGCADTDEVTITVIPRVIIVNTFSPNGDGINETWELQRIENFPEATVEIFNRWGTKVFTSDVGYKKAWDGKYNGQDLPLATYYYIIRLDKTSKPISGNVTLVR